MEDAELTTAFRKAIRRRAPRSRRVSEVEGHDLTGCVGERLELKVRLGKVLDIGVERKLAGDALVKRHRKLRVIRRVRREQRRREGRRRPNQRIPDRETLS